MIKFRGKIGGRWGYSTPEDNIPGAWDWEQFWALVDKSTVGQYIGMEDKNGTEIYEGDTVADAYVLITVAFGDQEFADSNYEAHCMGYNLDPTKTQYYEVVH